MSSIQQILASILNAVYGKDVRQAIHDGVEMAYNKADDAATSAAAAAEAASGSQESAAASAQAASNSASSASDFADAAEQYKNEAFHTTPAGYEAFVGEVNSSLEYLAETGVKNLIDYKGTSKEENGLTFTVNDDGTVAVTGTASANTWLHDNNLPLPTGNYKLSGCPSGGSAPTYQVYAKVYGASSDLGVDYGSGVEFALSQDSRVQVSILIKKDIVIPSDSPLIFKPMITDSDCPNSNYAHYQPYAQSNVALTKLTANAIEILDADLGTEQGITYFVKNGTHTPPVSDDLWYFIHVIKYNDSHMVQFAFPINLSNKMYIRKKYSGTWYDWREVTTSAVS